MILLLSMALAQDELMRGGVAAAYGRSYGPQTGVESWSAWAGMRSDSYTGLLWMSANLGLLVVKLPPGSVTTLELAGSVGLAPWQDVGPRVGLQGGLSAGLAQVGRNVGFIAGVGLGPVGIDLRLKRGARGPTYPNQYRALMLEVGFLPQLD